MAGKSLIAFGVTLSIGSFLVAIFLDAMIIDPAAVIVIALGVGVTNGSQRAAKWAIGIMCIYVVLTLLLAVATVFGDSRMLVVGRPIRLAGAWWAIASTLLYMAAWAAVNVGFLLTRLRRPEPMKQS